MHELQLFGDPVLRTGGGDPLPLWRPHLALLARLALAPQGRLPRGVLAGVLYPEVTEAKARTSLRQALFRLRSVAGDVVAGEGEAVRLSGAALRIDVWEFERLLDAAQHADAAALYRGDFLAGFALASAPFDHWADGERARLAARLHGALETLAEQAIGAGDWNGARRWAERWLEVAPFSESAARWGLAARAAAGDVADALVFYRWFSERLNTDLGIAPGPELQALVRRIEQDPRGRVTAAPAPISARLQPLPELPMVGREAEFARIRGVWDAAVAGRHQLVVITGEPGIGKSRLARELAGWARVQGAVVLTGRAYEVERGIPYAALTGVLNAALDARGLAGVDAESLGELTRIVPEIAHRFRTGVAPPMQDLGTGRVRLLQAVRQLFLNLAYEAPLLVVLDDLPWADEATIATLHHVWRTLSDQPFLLLATARAAELEAEPALAATLAALQRDAPDAVAVMKLAPLTTAAIERLAEAVGLSRSAPADEPLHVALERETGGNPFFLAEALRGRLDGGDSPASREAVRTMVADLTARLDPAARDLLRAAAVLGRRFPLPLVVAVAQPTEQEPVDALEQLVARRLLVRAGYEYDFAHDLLRQAVYASLSIERRRVLHRRAFARLAQDVGEAPGRERAGALATHAAHAALHADAYHWLLRAAELSREVFAGAEAERFLRQAASHATTSAEHSHIREQLGNLMRVQSRFTAAAAAYREAIGYTESGSTSRLRLRTKLLDAALRAGLVQLEQASDAVATLLADAARAGSACLRDALAVAATASLRAGSLERAETYAADAVRAARRAGEPAPLIAALLLHVQAGALRGTLADGLPPLDEAVHLASRHGLLRELCDAQTERSSELCRQGRWSDAIAAARSALDHATAAGAVGAATVAHVNLGDVLLRRGDWDEATSHLDRAWALAQQFDFPHVRADVLVNRALLEWHRGDAAATATLARAAIATAAALHMYPAERAARALLALALIELDRIEEAAACLEAASPADEPSHPTWGDDRELAVLARARLLARAGDAAAAERVLTDALEVISEPYAAALLMLELATVQGPDDAAARRLAQQARATLDALGAHPVLNRGTHFAPDAAQLSRPSP